MYLIKCAKLLECSYSWSIVAHLVTISHKYLYAYGCMGIATGLIELIMPAFH